MTTGCGHPCGCPSYRSHLLTIGVAISEKAAKVDRRENLLRSDLDAYKRLRADGLQPKGTGGSAHIERHAEHAVEVESGVLFSDVKRQMAGGSLA